MQKGKVSYKGSSGPVAGAVARVESAADVQNRVTATRLLAVGVFAFAVKKSKGHVYLSIEHPEYAISVEVPVKKEADARGFASKVNNASKAAAAASLVAQHGAAPSADAAQSGPAPVPDVSGGCWCRNTPLATTV